MPSATETGFLVGAIAERLVARSAAPAQRSLVALVEDLASSVAVALVRAAPARGRRVRNAPDGHSATAVSTSSAAAASTFTHGRPVGSNTCGSARTQFREW